MATLVPTGVGTNMGNWKTNFRGPQTMSWGSGLEGTGGVPAPVPAGDVYFGDLTGTERDAAAALMSLFNQYNLGALATKIITYVQDGLGADAIALTLQDTPEWKLRFAGNEQRKKAGLPILAPAEYLATETAYRQVMQQFGMPSGFYDSPADFAGFIGRDLSAQELQGRVQEASAFATNEDPQTKDALRRLYGIGDGELAAWALDKDRALPLLQKQARAVQIAAAAGRHNLGSTRIHSERLADLGVTQEAAEEGYSQIASMLPTFEQLGNTYGEQYGQEEAEEELFAGSASAARTRKSLASQERAAFSGSSRGQVGRTRDY